MKKVEEAENPDVQMENSTMKMSVSQLNEGLIKITDEDLQPLWKYLDSSYKLSFNI
jgi:hypothetical protein